MATARRKEPTPIAVPEDAAAGSIASSSPPSEGKIAISTVAAAGRHNSYIWRKLDYFYPWRLAYDPAPMGKTEDQTDMPKRYARAAFLVIVLATLGFFVTNCVLLPLHLVAYGLVISEVMRSRGHVAKWNPTVLRISEYLVGAWMGLVATLLELLGMEVSCAGDVLSPDQIGEGALILSNHPSTADWVYLWSWMLRFGELSHLKIVLKASLHKVPIAGWALQTCRYLFLHRQWQQDRAHMEVIAKHWAGGGSSSTTDATTPVQLLIFPEGTDIRPVSYDQSCRFVEKEENRSRGLVQFQHVLQPRVTGFVHLVKLLRQTGNVKNVYDLTIGASPFPITIENLLRGVLPQRMHFHLRRYELSTLPHGDVQLADWIQQRWREKDDRLEEFYAQEDLKTREFRSSAEERKAQQQFAEQRKLNLNFKKFSILLGFGIAFFWQLSLLFRFPLLFLLFHVAASGAWIYFGRTENGFDSLILKVEQQAEEQVKKQRGEPTVNASATALSPSSASPASSPDAAAASPLKSRSNSRKSKKLE